MQTATLELHSTPPSINVTGVGRASSRGAAIAQSKVKKRLQADLELVLLAELGRRELGTVQATALLRFPTPRRRDEGNYRAVIEKALGDALTNGSWLVDDTPEFFTFGALTFDPELGPARTWLSLDYSG